MEKCSECRFCWKNNGLASFEHCGAIRKAYGADEGKCKTRKYQNFEPVLRSGMRVKLRNLYAQDVCLFERGRFDFLNALNISFVLITSAKKGFWDIRVSGKQEYFTQIPERIIEPLKLEQIKQEITRISEENSKNCLSNLKISQNHSTHPRFNIEFFNRAAKMASGGVMSKPCTEITGQHADFMVFDDLLPPKDHFQKYDFKAKSYDHEEIINSAIQDNKRSFIVMGKHNTALVGILKNTKLFLPDIEGIKTMFAMPLPYDLFEIEKSAVNSWVKILKKERVDFEKQAKKKQRKIQKEFKKTPKKELKRFQVFTF